MPNQRFSIVIPTRQRHRTLAYAIQSVLLQPGDDYELIVQDNCSTEETAQIVRSYNSPKLRCNRAPSVLPMNENWEAALELCQGEWIFYLGDDDALMPDGLSLARAIVDRVAIDILMWDKYTYWWEDAIEPTLAGRMFLHLGHEYRLLDPKSILKGHYDWEIGFGGLPSIYTAFVKRTVVDRVKAPTGKYFYVGAPDHYTGIANAFFADSVGKFDRGLSLSGNSGQSTGTSYFFRSRGKARRDAYHGEERKTIAEIIHSALVPSVNLEINFADMMLRVKELLFPNDDRYQVPMHKVLAAMAANINRDPESYDETLAELHEQARRSGVEPSSIPVPPRAPGTKPRLQGLLVTPQGQPSQLAVHCAQAGVHEAASAARLAQALLPELTIQ
jgi:glycosyltransferase involved in cell wall biosynthesis